MAWVISESLEPIYIDDNWSNDNSCPVPCEECGCRDDCYWKHESSEGEDDINELDFLGDVFNVKF